MIKKKTRKINKTITILPNPNTTEIQKYICVPFNTKLNKAVRKTFQNSPSVTKQEIIHLNLLKTKSTKMMTNRNYTNNLEYTKLTVVTVKAIILDKLEEILIKGLKNTYKL
uniref:Uncharacterized protein n=1 Tax=Homalodisca liturata TaxID=320908 RepID=A0A1B6IYG5_9HEMI